MCSNEIPTRNGVIAILDKLRPWLEQEHTGSKVLLLCGCAGSGNSSLAKAVVERYPSFNRLSIDQVFSEEHGLYGVDYQPADYKRFQDEAVKILQRRLWRLLESGKNIVVDRPLYDKNDRLKYYISCKESGAAYGLVYFSAVWQCLWARTETRRKEGVDADSALPISQQLMKASVDSFAIPNLVDEPHILIDVKKYHNEGMPS